MFGINILWLMYNFSFKGDALYRLIPSGEINLLIPPDSLMGVQYHRTPAHPCPGSQAAGKPVGRQPNGSLRFYPLYPNTLFLYNGVTELLGLSRFLTTGAVIVDIYPF